MRDYSIKKYKGNTHYQVYVTDSYGREKGNLFRTESECHKFIYKIWDEEQPLTKEEIKSNLLSNAISDCIKIDIKNGKEPLLD
tara:strand:- start:687 stop:935 length:249 start_codon:yes stop_codon:yes gene_type:complete